MLLVIKTDVFSTCILTFDCSLLTYSWPQVLIETVPMFRGDPTPCDLSVTRADAEIVYCQSQVSSTCHGSSLKGYQISTNCVVRSWRLTYSMLCLCAFQLTGIVLRLQIPCRECVLICTKPTGLLFSLRIFRCAHVGIIPNLHLLTVSCNQRTGTFHYHAGPCR